MRGPAIKARADESRTSTSPAEFLAAYIESWGFNRAADYIAGKQP